MEATKRYHIAKKWWDGERLHKAGSIVTVSADEKPASGWTEITPHTVVEELKTPEQQTTAHQMQHARVVKSPASGPGAAPDRGPGARRVRRKKAPATDD